MRLEDKQSMRLNIAGIDVEPYDHSEVKSPRGTLLTIYIALSSDVAMRLNDVIYAKMRGSRDGQYFPVVIDGFPEVLEMRFGNIIWSQNDQVTKYELNLVEKGLDARPYSVIAYQSIGEGRRDRMVTETNAALGALISTLVAKGILTEEDRTSIHQAGKEQSPSLLLKFREVTDVDEWQEIATSFDVEDETIQ